MTNATLTSSDPTVLTVTDPVTQPGPAGTFDFTLVATGSAGTSVLTATGTNPDGSKYHDTGIPYVSYFNGGDALHGFIRYSYGYPQSLGCVEMMYTHAGLVWPHTPIGTLVTVS